MKIKSISASNFSCLSKVMIQLEHLPEVLLIVGKNGTGKSSLFDIIYFTLTGRSLKTVNIDKLVKRGTNEMETEIEFEYNKRVYKIKRIRKNKKTELDLSIDGKNVEADINKMQQIIADIIDAFMIETFMIYSGRSKMFFDLPERSQKLALTKLFAKDLDIDDVYAKVSSISNDVQTKISEIQASISEINRSLVDTKNLKNTRVKYNLEELNEYEEEYNSRKKELQQKVDKIEGDIDNIRVTIASNNNEIKMLKDRIKIYSELIKQGRCYVCKSKIGDVTKDKLQKDILELTSKVTIMQKDVEKLNKRLQKLQQVLNDTEAKIGGIEKKLSKISEYKTIIKSDISDKLIANLINKKRNLEQQLERYNEDMKFFLLLKQFYSSKGLLSMLSNMFYDALNVYAKKYINYINIDLEIKDNIQVLYNGLEYNMLSSGEKRIVDFIIMLACADIAHARLGMNVLVLDEIFDALDFMNVEKVYNMLLLCNVPKKILVTHHSVNINAPNIFDMNSLSLNSIDSSFSDYIKVEK